MTLDKQLGTNQNPNTASTDHTTWAYNNDDTILSVTDARGASATYGYNNNRHLFTSINYSAPSPITPTSNVTFGYDAAGNRISMTDGLGSKSYSYNQLSQVTSETRYFGSPLNQSFTLSYDYNLAGELKTITDPWAGTLNYGFDSTGRLNNMTGSGYGSVTQFASNLQYRAWNTLKSETYGNNFTESADYNSRMQMTGFQLKNASNQPQMSTTTQFYADGQVKFSHNALDERFDRAYSYDQAARITTAYSGSEARDFINNTNSGTPTGAYRQSYQFSGFNQITQQTNRIWNDTQTTTTAYTNNRVNGWAYDAAGFVTGADGTTYRRDAAGRNVQAAGGDSQAAYSYGGDGRLLKQALTHPGLHGLTVTNTTYYLTSTVLGDVTVAELGVTGQRLTRHVYAGAREVAQEAAGNITWLHDEPVTGSRGGSTGSGSYFAKSEFNADGIDIGTAPPVDTGYEIPDVGVGVLGLDPECNVADPNCVTCFIDHVAQPNCGHVAQLAQAGALQIEPENRLGQKKLVDLDVILGQLGYWQWQENYHRDQPPPESPDGIIRINNQGKYIWQPITEFMPQQQQSSPLRLGGTNQLKKLLEQTSKSCREAVQKLLNEIASENNIELTSSDPLELFNQITSQTGGGGIYVDVDHLNPKATLPWEVSRYMGGPNSSGSGDSFRFQSSSGDWQRVSLIYLRYTTGTEKSIGLAMAAYIVSGFHEMTHIAPKDRTKTISHDQMNKAARTLGGVRFDAYIEKYCVEKQYQSQP